MVGNRSSVKRTWVSSADYDRLRQHFDSSDKFLSKPNVIAPRLGNRGIPVWMSDENGGIRRDAVNEFLKRKFPFAGRRNLSCEGGCRRCPHCDFFQYIEVPGNLRNKCECRNCRETTLMLKWARVIWETYNERKTASQIETYYRWKPGTVGYIIQQIKRRGAGVRQDGKPRTGRPRGRPKTVGFTETIAA